MAKLACAEAADALAALDAAATRDPSASQRERIEREFHSTPLRSDMLLSERRSLLALSGYRVGCHVGFNFHTRLGADFQLDAAELPRVQDSSPDHTLTGALEDEPCYKPGDDGIPRYAEWTSVEINGRTIRYLKEGSALISAPVLGEKRTADADERDVKRSRPLDSAA